VNFQRRDLSDFGFVILLNHPETFSIDPEI
jgi:hypothetical protein